jgi:hypothetical protein
MLLYGKTDPRNFDPAFLSFGSIYNFNTMKEGYESLQILIPPNNIGHLDGFDFDVAYMQYIMNNDTTFVYFFRIINDIYLGKDVFLFADDNDWAENLIESLLKLIQQRYGINAMNIITDEDYIDAKLHGKSEIAAGYGVYNLDMDKERFIYILTSWFSQFGQIPFYVEGFFGEHDG